MKICYVFFSTFLVLNLAGCTSAAEKKDEAAAEYTEEKTETLKEYKNCIKDSKGDEKKLAQCEALLKAVGAVEGGTVTSAPAATPTTAPETPAAPTENSDTTETMEDGQ